MECSQTRGNLLIAASIALGLSAAPIGYVLSSEAAVAIPRPTAWFTLETPDCASDSWATMMDDVDWTSDSALALEAAWSEDAEETVLLIAAAMGTAAAENTPMADVPVSGGSRFCRILLMTLAAMTSEPMAGLLLLTSVMAIGTMRLVTGLAVRSGATRPSP